MNKSVKPYVTLVRVYANMGLPDLVDQTLNKIKTETDSSDLFCQELYNRSISHAHKNRVLKNYEAAWNAAKNGNEKGIYDSFDRLEESLAFFGERLEPKTRSLILNHYQLKRKVSTE